MALALAPEVRPGEHACCVFTSDDDQAHLVGRFAADAFARGDRVFYLADAADEDDVVAYLDAAGLDGRRRLDNGDVQIMHSSQMGLEDGFDSERMFGVWESLVGQAREAGCSGLAAAAEMTWAHTWKLDPAVLVEYEAAAAPVFASGELSALCQYDAREFEPSVLRSVRHAHPLSMAIRHAYCDVDYGRLHLESLGHDAFAIEGEIDLATSGFLEHELAHRLAAGDAIADCSKIKFVDVAGCRVLRRAALGGFDGGRLTLLDMPPAMSRVMTLCEWADAD